MLRVFMGRTLIRTNWVRELVKKMSIDPETIHISIERPLIQVGCEGVSQKEIIVTVRGMLKKSRWSKK